ncbi:hypothetical protein [Anatilimnocola floriformis]|uniref:hypothetical protein n=1 Tax=Anatilimnocola floriformis TaxID=2948575 RepID=UPI0020C47535|nr:hypothetical protein [Anatilimnocola floriformis]
MPLDSFDKHPRATEQMTLAEAYRAMLRVLEYYHGMGTDYAVGAILGDLCTGVWADGSPGDPAAWSLWLDSVDGKLPGA